MVSGAAKLAKKSVDRVPKGKTYYDGLRKKVIHRGHLMRKDKSDYWEIFRKGKKPKGKPQTSTSKDISDADRSMEELIRNFGRKVKDHIDDGG